MHATFDLSCSMLVAMFLRKSNWKFMAFLNLHENVASDWTDGSLFGCLYNFKEGVFVDSFVVVAIDITEDPISDVRVQFLGDCFGCTFFGSNGSLIGVSNAGYLVMSVHLKRHAVMVFALAKMVDASAVSVDLIVLRVFMLHLGVWGGH